MPLDVFDVIELGREGIEDIDDDDLPVSLALVEQGHDAKDLDLLDLTDVADLLADFADIKRVIVTLGFSLSVQLAGVLPGLGMGDNTISKRDGTKSAMSPLTWGNAP